VRGSKVHCSCENKSWWYGRAARCYGVTMTAHGPAAVMPRAAITRASELLAAVDRRLGTSYTDWANMRSFSQFTLARHWRWCALGLTRRFSSTSMRRSLAAAAGRPSSVSSSWRSRHRLERGLVYPFRACIPVPDAPAADHGPTGPPSRDAETTPDAVGRLRHTASPPPPPTFLPFDSLSVS
jgi:hypothetical protein